MKSHRQLNSPNSATCAAQADWRIAAIAIVVIGQLTSTPTTALAANGDDVTLPAASPSNTQAFSQQTGFQIKVNSTWSGSRGYRPIQVTATTAAPATADSLITIEFFAGNWRAKHRSITVEHDFDFPQGATTATARFLVPQHLDWNGVGWNVWVDGLKDKSLSKTSMNFNGGNQGAIAVGQLGGSMAGFGSSDGATLVRRVTNGAVEDLNFQSNGSDLPDSWVDYSSLDVFTTTVDALEMLRVSAPKKLAALLRWVRAGGNLWILDAGEDFAELPRLDRVFNAGEPAEAADRQETEPALGKWGFVRLADSGRSRVKDLVQLTMDQPPEETELSRSEIMDSRFPDTAVDSRRWYVAQSYGLGTILAIQEVESGRRRRSDSVSRALQRTTLMENLRWSKRHGNDPGTGNPSFNNWLIADVGAAPVGAFQMLISLFAIGIGPVNYWLLKRKNQLPALLLTVPAAALVTTILLFAYGFLADGIGTRLRARSVTMLDQVAGESASWARLSYYAGIAPSQGLELPKDTTIYPIRPVMNRYSPFGRRDNQELRTAVWQQQQELKGGWLGSRTPTQYLSITARPSEKRLEFETEADKLKVLNKLSTDVSTLIVQDHDGNLYLGEEIDDQEQVVLTRCEHNQAASTLRRIMTENLPELPIGYVENRSWRSNDYSSSMSESLMELQLEAINAPSTTGWGNGSYLAITSEGIELPLGLDRINEANSFHLVRGSW